MISICLSVNSINDVVNQDLVRTYVDQDGL